MLEGGWRFPAWRLNAQRQQKSDAAGSCAAPWKRGLLWVLRNAFCPQALAPHTAASQQVAPNQQELHVRPVDFTFYSPILYLFQYFTVPLLLFSSLFCLLPTVEFGQLLWNLAFSSLVSLFTRLFVFCVQVFFYVSFVAWLWAFIKTIIKGVSLMHPCHSTPSRLCDHTCYGWGCAGGVLVTGTIVFTRSACLLPLCYVIIMRR